MKCGGVIREVGKPYWDVLPSCSCVEPEVVLGKSYTTSTVGTDL